MKPFDGSKILGHVDRIAAWVAGEIVPPVTVEIDVTNAGFGKVVIPSGEETLAGLVRESASVAFSGGDSDVMRAVVTPAIRGDYVVTPAHLRGEQQLQFVGRDPGYRQDEVVLEDIY